MGADSTTEPFYPNNNCQGEWINDCPYMECQCAKKALDDMHELEEDYGKQADATAFGGLFWVIIVISVAAIIFAAWIDSLN